MELIESNFGSERNCHSDDGYSSVSSLCDCISCKLFQQGFKDNQHVPAEPNDNRQPWIPRHRLIKWSLPPPPVVAAPMPGWRSMPFGLETYWQSAFAWFFRPFFADHGHVWTLEPTDVPPMSVEWPWHSVHYSSKVRFLCPENHGWTSMKGRAQFWFRMRRQGSEIVCESLFRLFGQECSRCQQAYDEAEFVSPLWYPEEIENAFLFLSAEVSRVYYGGLSKEALIIRRIRKSNSRSSTFSVNHHHDPTRCQACLENQCTFYVAKNDC